MSMSGRTAALLGLIAIGTLCLCPIRAFAGPSPVSAPKPTASPQSSSSSSGSGSGGFGQPFTNRLAREHSPYLLQHAHNPVDWYPWGEEAFAKARREHKPIFLSVGYSTCHWCHVMEKESFENPTIAKLLNASFVSIKVDREERPDIDRIYMSYVESRTHSGGWPMSVWLTPELHPFLGGGYFPPEGRQGLPGFADLLRGVARAWQTQSSTIEQAAQREAERLARQVDRAGQGSDAPGALLDQGFSQLAREYDDRDGGFSSSPRFPEPSNLAFLLDYHLRTGNPRALAMVLGQLEAMARGGIHDQLGGGFHRYSTDARWRVPHFEKMLYDQAQLAKLYLDAYAVTGDARLAQVARTTLGYVAGTMTDAGGGFHGAEDADSVPDPAHPQRRREGAFYVWTYAQVEAAVGHQAMPLVADFWGITRDGNTGADPRGELAGQNVLFEAHPLAEVARRAAIAPDTARAMIDKARSELLAVRGKRPRPRCDDKVITAWNGLTISAFARAAQVLGDARFRDVAARAARFILASMVQPHTHRLLRTWRQGNPGPPALCEDYAFLIQALIDLYETDADWHWLDEAIRLQRAQIDLFADPVGGGFYESPPLTTDASLIVRPRDDQDGAEPAAGSISALNLLRLSAMGGDPSWHALAERTVRSAFSRLGGLALAAPRMLTALDRLLQAPVQIVIAGAPADPGTRRLAQVVLARYIPTRILLYADGGDGQKMLAARLPFIAGAGPIGGKAAASICHDQRCERPTTDPTELTAILNAEQARKHR